MALMASKSNAFIDPNSRLELKTCVEYLWLPTFIVWLLNLSCLLLHYRFNRYISNRKLPKDLPSDTPIDEQAHEEEQTTDFSTTTRTRLPRFTERFRLRQLGGMDTEPISFIQLKTSPLMIDRSVSVASIPALDKQIDETEISAQPSNSRLFKVILFILLITVIALLFASSDKVYFDIGM
jgi:hypothetical protein